MPILDHLAPDVRDIALFESFHSAWTTYIVEELNLILPDGFLAIPQTSIGAREVDVRADKIRALTQMSHPPYQPRAPLITRAEFPTAFEVFVDYIDRGRHITVGAIEIVSRGNKDRPSERDSFVSKCRNLIAKNVSLIVIDILATPAFNLHNQLLQAMHAADGYIDAATDQPLYCAAYRASHHEDTAWGEMEVWVETLKIGDNLPELPLYITSEVSVPVHLERSYTRVCQVLRIST
ncbi:DUF4058 family protein [Candidatus Entotheonella palauensis]|uniref:DUF4058 domain-containing protein n=1 Tax=Candidatus Entotheonella gemina TaxID=1429439 RepID=W4MDV9_9BACT|nr:DUF4058 family protein [Candidatus Entotheonella palauensis]ETX08126.1 MAG: hypothetical protein ETSY2_07195 [Candidatus Entotheonella gemina]